MTLQPAHMAGLPLCSMPEMRTVAMRLSCLTGGLCGSATVLEEDDDEERAGPAPAEEDDDEEVSARPRVEEDDDEEIALPQLEQALETVAAGFRQNNDAGLQTLFARMEYGDDEDAADNRPEMQRVAARLSCLVGGPCGKTSSGAVGPLTVLVVIMAIALLGCGWLHFERRGKPAAAARMYREHFDSGTRASGAAQPPLATPVIEAARPL